jgi:hypothetical protein
MKPNTISSIIRTQKKEQSKYDDLDIALKDAFFFKTSQFEYLTFIDKKRRQS